MTERAFEAAHLGGPVFDCADTGNAVQAVSQGREAGAVLISCRTEGEGDALAAAGFRKVETLVTLERRSLKPLDGRLGRGLVRAGGVADVPACRRVAVEALRWDRFHADPRIDDQAADALKAEWIENDLRGRADRVFVAEVDGAVAGFCAMLLRADLAVIDLIAVAPDKQGKGIGRALVAAAVDHYREQMTAMLVGTQAGNPASVSFYKSMGFQEVKRADTWHWTP
ncbi:GNAT family N-acetyltransferase [Hwanghaeella grinnelliae]|uniref:GNAT family N-acetyltransferase n=1 Tax=Hwanghaeella grinnelliae TaxID=2500179 RepID=UPI0013876439|nr:GNAT family N-acetyltransferase [Hwanghaeella grinnelliae]